jgi:tRNA(adenine34) deaminase
LPFNHFIKYLDLNIGAVIIDEQGVVVSTGRNRVESMKDCTRHAEIEAIRRASEIKDNWRLLGCTIYTTLEPCAMCMGAIQASRLKRVVFAARDIRLGACGSWVDLSTGFKSSGLESNGVQSQSVGIKHPYSDVMVDGGILSEESATLLKRFFQSRRRDNATIDTDIRCGGMEYTSPLDKNVTS